MVARTVPSIASSNRWTLSLSDAPTRSPEIAGAKAGALARALAADLPVVPGSVLTVDGTVAYRDRDATLESELYGLWSQMQKPLVVRSSSTIEDQGSSSMAGVFTSVLGVETWDELLRAIEEVIASAQGAPMAVLIQPQLDAAVGGVMFGLDPVTGRRDRIVVASVFGGPDALVSGRETGSRSILTHKGRRIGTEGEGPNLTRGDANRLAQLARGAQDAFGGPQDVEWAIDRFGKLWLLQSRPITAARTDAAVRPTIFGPGPVAETFPDALSPLELDLWADPLAVALKHVLPLVGAATSRSVKKSPVLIDVDGRLAIDLRLIGALPRHGLVAKLDPRPSLRRLGASWRVGRLRAAMPVLARDVLVHVDRELESFPSPAALAPIRLLEVLNATRQILIALHGHELMAGLIASENATGSGASIALRELAAARQAGLTDEEVTARYPSTLALAPPRIRTGIELPPLPNSLPPVVTNDALESAREELRLRVRFVHELTVRVAIELGRRMTADGVIAAPGLIRWAHLQELASMLDGSVVPLSLEDRTQGISAAPLPPMFRLDADGNPVEHQVKGGKHEGQGVSSGRAVGTAYDGSGRPPEDAVLIVRTLDPSLAPLLPQLTGLVAETGSVLSHLAILAREFGVPTVVDVPNAVDRFASGTRVIVDGSTGDVKEVRTGEAA